MGSDESTLLSAFPYDFRCDRGGIRYPKPVAPDIQKDVLSSLQAHAGHGLGVMFADEKDDLLQHVLNLMAAAYDEAFTDCEEQDSGFAGTTNWTNNNPYRRNLNRT
jgi:hypothetical protein